MSNVKIFGSAIMGYGVPYILANSLIEPTFYDYIDFEKCISDDPTYLNLTDYSYYEVNTDTCIVVAQPKVILTSGETKYFLRWDIGTLNKINQKWYHKELPIQKGMDQYCNAVYGLPCVAGKMKKIDYIKFVTNITK